LIIAALLSGKTLFCCWLCRKTHVLICTQAFIDILDLTEKVTETNNIVLLAEKEEPYFNSNSLPFTLGPSDLAPRIKVLRQRQEQLQCPGRNRECCCQIEEKEPADLETVTRYVADLHNLLNDSTLAEKKSFIRSFISEVRVAGKEAL